ncbi:hypothetical protein OAR19_00560, partial [bacterium]|nr:hypothetical protein [bacterium]
MYNLDSKQIRIVSPKILLSEEHIDQVVRCYNEAISGYEHIIEYNDPELAYTRTLEALNSLSTIYDFLKSDDHFRVVLDLTRAYIYQKTGALFEKNGWRYENKNKEVVTKKHYKIYFERIIFLEMGVYTGCFNGTYNVENFFKGIGML